MPPAFTICRGKCVRVAEFGAFVEVPGCSKWGLVHVTQLQDTGGRGGAKVNVTDVVEVGDEVWVKVLEVDEEQGKMSLSMKYVSQVTLVCVILSSSSFSSSSSPSC